MGAVVEVVEVLGARCGSGGEGVRTAAAGLGCRELLQAGRLTALACLRFPSHARRCRCRLRGHVEVSDGLARARVS